MVFYLLWGLVVTVGTEGQQCALISHVLILLLWGLNFLQKPLPTVEGLSPKFNYDFIFYFLNL